MPLLNRLFRRNQHIFNKASVTSCRVIHKHTGHRAHQLADLNDGTA